MALDQTITEQYRLWCEKAVADKDVVEELKLMSSDEKKTEEAFYRNLSFGTGGLRGIIGAGTNRMNVYTVAKASQGLADYVKKNFVSEKRKIAVSYDSRIKSDLFAKVASGVFAANHIEVAVYPELMPTPCLSFAVRELGCAAGIMITASHNPSEYNGYKVYGPDGCQITTEAAAEILAEIEKLDIFADVQTGSFEEGMASGKISYIGEEVYDAFVENVKRQSCAGGREINKDVAIVYSPLNGTGLKPVLRTLRESGYTNITVVKEQERPDGSFPTCPYPNPEIREAMALGSMPKDPVCIKTIVTSDMAERNAAGYGVRTMNVLTGFKYIGEQIGRLEKEGRVDSYLFGLEESYGYLSGSYVRDKDAVNAAFLICEMFAWYRTQGIGLLEKLEELYAEYGYCLNTLHSFYFEGVAGADKMQEIMKRFRQGIDVIGSKKVLECLDYSKGLDGFPKSNVLKYLLEDHCSVVIRPSGTEPKLKVYVSVSADSKETAEKIEEELMGCVTCSFVELPPVV